MGNKWEEKLSALGRDMDQLSRRAAAAADDAKAARELGAEAIQNKITSAKGDITALQENVRLAEEENRSKLSSALLKAQMTIRAKVEDHREARDKKLLEAYINDHIDYVLDCYDAAALLIANAELAILETMDAAIAYETRFGTSEEEAAKEKPEA